MSAPNEMSHAVVVPCFKEKKHVLDVLKRIPTGVTVVYCVDDACPIGTGKHIEENCRDSRVKVLYNSVNTGVGGAVKRGYQQALADGADIVVKLDGDGQMDPALIPDIVAPIVNGQADYAKGNRFYQLDFLEAMPAGRIIGNAGLSFLTKLSTGYWNIFDPTNGFTAVHANVLRLLPLEKIDDRYFFESDMLFRLGTIRAVVVDVPQKAVYGDETSHLNVLSSIPKFAFKHFKNILKRLFYNYFLRDFSVASIEWIIGPALLIFGLMFGMYTWTINAQAQTPTPTGTIMIIALSLIVGLQLLLSALQFDVQNLPRLPLQRLVSSKQKLTTDIHRRWK